MIQETTTRPRIKTRRMPLQWQRPLQIVLHQELGNLPTGITIELSNRDLANSLIARRLATPVANLMSMADLVLEDDDLEHVGVDLWSVEAA